MHNRLQNSIPCYENGVDSDQLATSHEVSLSVSTLFFIDTVFHSYNKSIYHMTLRLEVI